MNILGIESTCDETGVALVKDGRKILSNIVASSVDLHKKYGGVVPEIAAREQVRSILPVIAEAVANTAKARGSLEDKKIINWAKKNIDAIAVACGPGLIGSLLVGVETAKTLALAWQKPLIAVNHLIGHVYANWLEPISNFPFDSKLAQGEQFQISNLPKFPLVALIVSGGHTELILMHEHGKYQWLGGTLDDACGETFDKVARMLGLGYPGGPEIERVAQQLTIDKEQVIFRLPRPMTDTSDFDFSFSGLKTSVLNLTRQLSPIQRVQGDPEFTEGSNVKGHVSAIAYEFQNAVIDVLITKTLKAALKFNVKSVVVGGGVAANDYLRKQFTVHCSQFNITVHFPPKKMSVDNGAMIAAAGYFLRQLTNPLELQAIPSLRL